MKYLNDNCIYIIGCKQMPNLYKIGKSKNINGRFKGYKTHNPHKMDIIHLRYIKNMTLAENILKTTLSHFHYENDGGKEWYKCNDVNILIEEIENVGNFLERQIGYRKIVSNYIYIVGLIPLSTILYYIYNLTS